MTDHPPSHDGPSGKQKPMWPGFLLGLFVVAPAVTFVSVLGPGFGFLMVVVLIGSPVLLFLRDPFLRGLGAGVLAAAAIVLIVLFAVCYSYIQESS